MFFDMIHSLIKKKFAVIGKFLSYRAKNLGGNSQNFLGKFLRFFETLRCFYTVVIHRK